MNRVIKIGWGGKEVEIKPTMELAHELEELFPIVDYIMNLDDLTKFSLTNTVSLFEAVLNFGGIEVSKEDIYGELSEASFAEISPIIVEILSKVFPMFFNQPKKSPKKGQAKKG
jgi:hypothetical protein